jgi:hypothetical protein
MPIENKRPESLVSAPVFAKYLSELGILGLIAWSRCVIDRIALGITLTIITKRSAMGRFLQPLSRDILHRLANPTLSQRASY